MTFHAPFEGADDFAGYVDHALTQQHIFQQKLNNAFFIGLFLFDKHVNISRLNITVIT